MTKAIWNGKVLAQSDETVRVEGNHYFPPGAIKREFFEESQHLTLCPWKGVASYYNVRVDGKMNANAAWYYPAPSEAAGQIRDYIAFWHGVQVVP